MRGFAFLVLVAATWVLLAGGAFAQGSQPYDFTLGFGVLNGPTGEVRGANWLVQASWLLYTMSSGDFKNNFDEGFAVRADYVFPLGGERGRDILAELGIGGTLFRFTESVVTSVIPGQSAPSYDYNETGVNAQFIYHIQPNMTFRACYDHFLDKVDTSPEGLWSFGILYHF